MQRHRYEAHRHSVRRHARGPRALAPCLTLPQGFRVRQTLESGRVDGEIGGIGGGESKGTSAAEGESESPLAIRSSSGLALVAVGADEKYLDRMGAERLRTIWRRISFVVARRAGMMIVACLKKSGSNQQPGRAAIQQAQRQRHLRKMVHNLPHWVELLAPSECCSTPDMTCG